MPDDNVMDDLRTTINKVAEVLDYLPLPEIANH
jgi:hypothetical protein